MKAVFMGTPAFSARVLQDLIDHSVEVLAVVTKEDKKRSRGKDLDFSEVKKKALEYGLEVLQPAKLKEEGFIQRIKEMNPDIIVTAAYGKIVPKVVLDIPKYGCINVHASLLPKYRGASPIQQAIMDGEEKTGITIIQMDEGMDTGDMLLKEELAILEDETSDELFERLAVMGGRLCVDCIKRIKENRIVPVKQKEEEATYTGLIPKEAGHLKFNEKAKVLANRIRAIECYYFYKEQKVKVLKARAVELKVEELNKENGSIIRADKEGFVIKCPDSGLHIDILQLPGKKPCDYKAYMNGYRPEAGSILN